MTIELMPQSERPRERCLNHDPTCLSLRECLAIILNSGPPKIGCLGLASRILDRFNFSQSENELERAFFASLEIFGAPFLREIPGLGDSGRARVMAAFELGRRYSHHRVTRMMATPSTHPVSQVQLKSKSLTHLAIRNIPEEHRNRPKEWLAFIPVYSDTQIGGFCLVENGVRTHVNIDPRELFTAILSVRAPGFFLFHNHPSGNIQPSFADQELTAKVLHLASELDLQFLGHAIITPNAHQWIEVCYPSY